MGEFGEIYLVIPGQERDDYNGRGYTSFHLEEEYDEQIGYFGSREDAQAWIDEQNGEGNAAYQQALAEYPAKAEKYRLAEAKHRDEQNAIAVRARAANVPYTFKHRYVAPPRQPVLSEFVKTEYKIWEINPHETKE